MTTQNFVSKSFIDGLLYKPSDIKTLVESDTPDTLRIIKLGLIIEKMEITSEEELIETIDYLESYKLKIENSSYSEDTKKQYLTEISNLILGVVKFLAPWVIKFLGWISEKVVSTEVFGKSATAVSQAIKKVTPDVVKKALTFAKDTYKNADAAFQNIAKTVQEKVQAAFKGSEEKPPLINSDAIAKAHANLVAKIETWPGIGKVISLGKKMGITPQGFYKFLGIAILSVLAMTGSFGAAVILVLYGANIAAQRIVKAGGEAGSKVASAASRSMDKASGEASPASSDKKDDFAELDALLADFDKSTSTAQPSLEELPNDLEPIANKWSELLKKYVDSNDTNTASTKIKSAIQSLLKSGDLKSEQIKPLLNTVIKKANTKDDFNNALWGALVDAGIIASS